MTSFATQDVTLTLTLRRDYAAATKDLPAMHMGATCVSADVSEQVTGLFRSGVRQVDLDEVIDLTGDTSARQAVKALVLVRELTAHGLVVNWRIRLPGGMQLPLLLGHLYPPQTVVDSPYGAQIAELWRARFYVGKCFWRQGPGFVEVRDRRSARQVHVTIDDPQFVSAIEPLSRGAALGEIPEHVLDHFTEAGFVHRVEEYVWWTPYRIRRWPSPPVAV